MAFQSTVSSNYEEIQPLFMPGLEVLLCAILGLQPSSESSISGSADILQLGLGLGEAQLAIVPTFGNVPVLVR